MRYIWRLGSFTSNPNGTITHRKYVGYKKDGNRKIITVTAANKSACIKEMKIKEQEWLMQQQANSISLEKTVLELCQLHLDY